MQTTKRYGAMSRDVQVRVVFCDWLAWLLHVKRSGHDISLKSLLDKRETRGRRSMEDVPSLSDIHSPSTITNKVLTLSSTWNEPELRPIKFHNRSNRLLIIFIYF